MLDIKSVVYILNIIQSIVFFDKNKYILNIVTTDEHIRLSGKKLDYFPIWIAKQLTNIESKFFISIVIREIVDKNKFNVCSMYIANDGKDIKIHKQSEKEMLFAHCWNSYTNTMMDVEKGVTCIGFDEWLNQNKSKLELN